MRDLVILGAGGFARQVSWIAHRSGEYRVVGFVDETLDSGSSPDCQGIPVANSIHSLIDKSREIELVAAVGDIEARRRWYAAYHQKFRFASIYDPSALISTDAQTGEGVIVLGQAVCSTSCKIGDSVLVNWQVVIAHDAKVGSFSNVSSGAKVTGGAIVGERCDIGTNAVVLPRIRVNEGAVVGAGAIVTKDVPPNAVVGGVPARVIKWQQ